MYQIAKDLIALLSQDQAKALWRLQFFIVFAACLETISVMSIAPFMGLVVDMSLLDSMPYLATFASYFNVFETKMIVIFVGFGVIALLAVSSIVSMFTLWRLSLFGARFGMELGDRLFTLYMTEEWLFHTKNNTSDLVKQISEDSLRVADNLITPLLLINARLAVCFLIVLGMMLFNPLIALGGVAVLGCAFICIYSFLKLRLIANAITVTQMSAKRFRIMFEGFASIKDVILRSNYSYFVNKFSSSGRELAKARGSNLALAITPRYLMELVVFGSLVLLLLFIVNDGRGSLMDSLPTLAFFGFAVFRLMPGLQQIYASSAQIKGNEYAFTSIKEDLNRASLKVSALEKRVEGNIDLKIALNNKISLKDVCFKYPEQTKFALDRISLDVAKGEILGLVGDSGSGKSTLGDLLLGLISPLSGEMVVDSEEIDSRNLTNWRNSVGYVPQAVTLLDTSFLENIAFGVDGSEIDHSAVNSAITSADLDTLISSNPLGVSGGVGEGGILLSGGQRQRVALARSLYSDSQLIVFDEATSALDAGTQERVMQSILMLKKNAAIVLITHSHATLSYCDKICLMSDGCLIDYGSAAELILRHDRF
jgi:HlyD family secretion protein